MNNLFRKMPLHVKLILLAVFPLSLLIVFMLQINKERTAKIAIVENYLARAEGSADIAMAINELQVERRYSFGYIMQKNWRNELVVQRPKTDAIVRHLENNPLFKGIRSYTFLDSLETVRSMIDRHQFSTREVMDFYSNTILRLNSMNAISAGNIMLQPIIGDMNSQKLLSEMVTYLGMARASVYQAIHSNVSATEAATQVKPVYVIFKSYEREFMLKGSAESISRYREFQQDTVLKSTLGVFEHLIQTGTFNAAINPEQWWTISAAAVDNLRNLQQESMNKARQGLVDISNKEKTARDRTLILMIVIVVLVLVIMMYAIVTISNTLNDLNAAARKIALGITGVEIHSDTRDVIGNLARSMKLIDENNQALAKAADAIGRGNFNIDLTPRSENDELVNAVIAMRGDLKQFRKENSEKLWVHAGLEKINAAIRGDKEVKVLAEEALDTLISYVNGHIGLLYVARDSYLHYAAGYALPDINAVSARIRFGESLIGKAAEKRDLIRLTDVPEDFVKIRTGSGEALPRNLLIVPLIHNDIVEGVVEIGSFQPFSDLALSYIQNSAAPVAVAIQAAKSRARLQELLEETQSQSEELQAQHSELENVNAELEAQTERLQTSEEELRVQQEELLQVNQELEERSRLLEERNQLIVERNLEIQQKAKDLELSTKYKSDFLANMSHELRTPLNSVLLLSRLLTENNDKNLTKEQVEYAQVIQSSGQGLLSLIDEILDLSKIEAGKMDLEYQQVSLKEITGDMRALFTPIAKERGVEFNIVIGDDLPSMIETDKMRLEQVLRNLLSNALKFTSRGSVELIISKLKDNNSFLAFIVKDTGIGIPHDKQELIFEAFQQADGSTRRKYGGTGLGLSISRELSKLLGGDIKVTSEPGKGSEFTVYIPVNKIKVETKPVGKEDIVADPEQERQKPANTFRITTIPESIPDDRNDIDENSKSILIVEDDTVFAKTLLEFTRQKGYKGLVAVRGDEGISLAKEFRPVGILLDIHLPVKDGWEVMEELKSSPLTRHIPVHIMSSEEAKRESLVKGAVDFINKPVAIDQMQDVFNKIEQIVSHQNNKVLIVEENPKHARALAYFLETFNINAQISDSISEGVHALKSGDLQCVILDMGIPDQQAYQTLEQVKQDMGLENLPVIIFTGKNLSKSEETKIRQYADSIVIKTAHSYQRILDEVSLFLHLMEENNVAEKQSRKYKRLGALNEVLANKKILVTDDDVRNIFSLTKALEIHNMQVITAVDGKEALKQLEEHPDTHAVLMDIMMPEMDGFEAMEMIRSKKQFKKLPIIAVTAKAMTGDREKCIKAGASDYISKPVDIDQLLSLLRVWLYDKSM